MASQDSQATFHWHYSEFDDRNFQINCRTFFYAVVLFSLTLLASLLLLLLLARWIRRHPPPPPSQPPLGGLDAATICGIPIVLHGSSTKSEGVRETDCCSICLGLFEGGEKVKLLPRCRHFYHSVCVDAWLCSQSSCPICRSSLGPDSPV